MPCPECPWVGTVRHVRSACLIPRVKRASMRACLGFFLFPWFSIKFLATMLFCLYHGATSSSWLFYVETLLFSTTPLGRILQALFQPRLKQTSEALCPQGLPFLLGRAHSIRAGGGAPFFLEQHPAFPVGGGGGGSYWSSLPVPSGVEPLPSLLLDWERGVRLGAPVFSACHAYNRELRDGSSASLLFTGWN